MNAFASDDIGPVCRGCGCTDWNACIEPDGWPCCWVEENLCSACAYRANAGEVELRTPAELERLREMPRERA